MPPVAVNRQGDQVDMSINLDFYPMPKVLMAAQDFSGACWVNVQELSNARLKVSIRPKSSEQDVSVLGHEFFNYLLSLVKAR